MSKTTAMYDTITHVWTDEMHPFFLLLQLAQLLLVMSMKHHCDSLTGSLFSCWFLHKMNFKIKKIKKWYHYVLLLVFDVNKTHWAGSLEFWSSSSLSSKHAVVITALLVLTRSVVLPVVSLGFTVSVLISVWVCKCFKDSLKENLVWELTLIIKFDCGNPCMSQLWRHTPSIAFRHLPPNSARFSYATEGALFISAQLSTDAITTLPKLRVLIWL